MRRQYKNLIAGLALGSLSLLLTFQLRSLIPMDPGIMLRALKAAGFALVVPGLIPAVLTRNPLALRVPVMGTVNFLFWFGFGWLFATFVTKIAQLRRAIAAVGTSAAPASAERSSSSLGQE
ncbi:hypothetical protein DYQ86_04095 [Acidobacteria bacterium AB60]|nr:hypothetical protein DYQ86_04095 [Acidobacteria bacterium AB60]